MTESTKYLLFEDRIPKHWYNIQADLPKPLSAVLHPGTKQSIGPDDLAPLFPMALIQQEVSTEREIEIPEPVRDVYKIWRPAPLFRARRLSRREKTDLQQFPRAGFFVPLRLDELQHESVAGSALFSASSLAARLPGPIKVCSCRLQMNVAVLRYTRNAGVGSIRRNLCSRCVARIRTSKRRYM